MFFDKSVQVQRLASNKYSPSNLLLSLHKFISDPSDGLEQKAKGPGVSLRVQALEDPPGDPEKTSLHAVEDHMRQRGTRVGLCQGASMCVDPRDIDTRSRARKQAMLIRVNARWCIATHIDACRCASEKVIKNRETIQQPNRRMAMSFNTRIYLTDINVRGRTSLCAHIHHRASTPVDVNLHHSAFAPDKGTVEVTVAGLAQLNVYLQQGCLKRETYL
uniref:Uncharacterized protein n=1 Tax=Romanomermis culicivorax TaxID=13658 RepID=A0A915KB55_ROMCU